MGGREVEIPSEEAGAELPAYAAIPDGATRGVVVLHEVLGRQPEIDRVVDRFARAGYAAVAPDLFAAGARIACIRALVEASARGVGRPVDDVLRARRWLCAQARLDETRVGLIGFCITGGFVLAIGRGWGAVSANYGGVAPDDLLRGIAPVIGCYGGRDRVFRGSAPKLRDALARVGATGEVHTFPTVGHSFLTDGRHPIAKVLTWPLLHVNRDPAVAEEAWSRIFDFFARHLSN